MRAIKGRDAAVEEMIRIAAVMAEQLKFTKVISWKGNRGTEVTDESEKVRADRCINGEADWIQWVSAENSTDYVEFGFDFESPRVLIRKPSVGALASIALTDFDRKNFAKWEAEAREELQRPEHTNYESMKERLDREYPTNSGIYTINETQILFGENWEGLELFNELMAEFEKGKTDEG